MQKKYNIDFSLDDLVSIKNETVCRITKKSPKDLFFDENIDEEEIKRVNYLMQNSQKNANIYGNVYSKGEKILIYKNIRISNKTTKKNNKKIGIYNITAEIVKEYSGCSYFKILMIINFFQKVKNIILILH